MVTVLKQQIRIVFKNRKQKMFHKFINVCTHSSQLLISSFSLLFFSSTQAVTKSLELGGVDQYQIKFSTGSTD